MIDQVKKCYIFTAILIIILLCLCYIYGNYSYTFYVKYTETFTKDNMDLELLEKRKMCASCNDGFAIKVFGQKCYNCQYRMYYK